MNPQSISGIFSKLVPFRAIADDADAVVIQPGQIFSPYPAFRVVFGKYVPAVAEIPAVPAIPQKSGPNRPDYAPAVPGVPAVPAVPAQFVPHREEILALTKEEWDGWDNSISDEAYVLSLVAKRYNQTLIAAKA